MKRYFYCKKEVDIITLEYKADMIEYLQENGEPIVGYLDKNGDIINYIEVFYSNEHTDWKNPISQIFLKYISYFNNHTYDDEKELLERFLDGRLIKENKYDKLGRIVLHGMQDSSINFKKLDVLLKQLEEDIYNINFKYSFDNLKNDLLKLFLTLYQSGDFFKALGFEIKIDIDKEERNIEIIKSILLAYLKDICVCYLGYDSFAMSKLKLNEAKKSIFDGLPLYNIVENSKIITTSCNNPYERFYNYLLMDWRIDRVPRYYWDEKSKCFKIESKILSFYQTEKEENFAKELKSLKKINLENRRKYFR